MHCHLQAHPTSRSHVFIKSKIGLIGNNEILSSINDPLVKLEDRVFLIEQRAGNLVKIGIKPYA